MIRRSLLLAAAAAALAAPSLRAADVITDLLWQVLPSDMNQDFITTGSTERGMSYNPATGNVLVASRAGGNRIVVLNGATGAKLHELDMTDVFGGTFVVNKVGVADDGAVYACNLVLNASSNPLKIYRWPSDAAGVPPTIAFEGNPDPASALRWGDTLAVRGSGAGTQLLAAAGLGNSVAALFTTADGADFSVTLLPGAAHAGGSLGVDFGAGNTAYFKANGAPLRRVPFDPSTGAIGSADTFLSAPAYSAILPIGVDSANSRLGGVGIFATDGAGVDEVYLFDITSPDIEPSQSSMVTVTEDNPNTNRVGAVDFGPDTMYVLATNCGLYAYELTDFGIVEPPTIAASGQPASVSILEDGIVTLSVSPSGTAPFTFQWKKDGDDIPDATDPTLDIGPVSADDAADYTVVVSNSAGDATSDPATVTILPRVDTDVSDPKWTAAPGDAAYPFLDSSSSTQRGLAYNPVTGNVLVATRTLGAEVHVIDGDSGAPLHTLDMTGVTGGLFALNMIDVADDGAVYVGNLVLNGVGDSFRIYRWPSDAAGIPPTVAYSGDPGEGTAHRWGDTLAVRGSGASTEVLAASRTQNVVALFRTVNGTDFTSSLITVPGDPAPVFGIGIDFGDGNEFWGKNSGGSLHRVSFTPGVATGSVITTYPTSVIPGSATALAVDPERNCLAFITLDAPNTIRVYDITDPANPQLVDQELFNNGRVVQNVNGTGDIAFGATCLFGLSTNNGILALDLNKVIDVRPEGPFLTGVRSVDGNPNDRFEFTLNGDIGASYVIQTSGSPGGPWENLQIVTLASEAEPYSFPITEEAGFFRVVEVVD